jgi:hypothetical protein
MFVNGSLCASSFALEEAKGKPFPHDAKSLGSKGESSKDVRSAFSDQIQRNSGLWRFTLRFCAFFFDCALTVGDSKRIDLIETQFVTRRAVAKLLLNE